MKSLKRKNLPAIVPAILPSAEPRSLYNWSAARLWYTKLYDTQRIYRNSKMADEAVEELHESLLQFVSLSFGRSSKSLSGWLNHLFL